MASGSRYKLTLTQTLFEQTLQNVFFYEQFGGTLTRAQSLFDAFDLEVLTDLKTIQSDELTYDSIAIENVDDPSDFYIAAPVINGGGNQTGEVLPPYACYAFRYNRTTMAVRNGQKRFGGVPEAANANGVLDATYNTAVANVETALGDDITDGTTNPQYRPKIAHRVFDTDTPPNLIDYTFYGIASVQYVRLSTQNTRKFGRGI